MSLYSRVVFSSGVRFILRSGSGVESYFGAGSYSRLAYVYSKVGLHVCSGGLILSGGPYTRVGLLSGVDHTLEWTNTQGWTILRGGPYTGWAYTLAWAYPEGELILWSRSRVAQAWAHTQGWTIHRGGLWVHDQG